MNQSEKKLYGLCGKLKTKSGKGLEFVSNLLQGSEMMKKVKGCYLYSVGQDEKDPDMVWVMEVWENKEDHDNSLQLPAVRELIMKSMPLIEGKPEGSGHWIHGGLGISELKKS